MRTVWLTAGGSALATASIAAAAAGLLFSYAAPGSTRVTLEPDAYDTVATRARGGNGLGRALGGVGALVGGTFVTTPETLSILAGGLAGSGADGAGGASFVVESDGTPLLIGAGGDGGAASLLGSGGPGVSLAISGNGNGNGNGNLGGGGNGNLGGGGFSFVNVAAARVGAAFAGSDGFGGGGSSETALGGGFSDLNGGSDGLGGVGGTSFNAGANPLFSPALAPGDGSVVITQVQVSTPEPISLALFATGLAGLLATHRRKQS